MKTNSPASLRDVADDNEESSTPQPIEDLVEDLAQQDVLPSDSGGVDVPDEPITGGLDETGRWDEPIGERGHRAVTQELEDEAVYEEQLVDDGLDEADEELRELDEDQEKEEEQEFEEDQP